MPLSVPLGMSCQTHEGAKCIFPWIDSGDGLKYKGCKQEGKGLAWCPNQVNLTGHFMETEGHLWGTCSKNCPISQGIGEPVNDGTYKNAQTKNP